MRLEVARVGRAHGLRGEVHLVPISNRPERFVVGSVLYAGDQPLRIVAVRPQQDHWLVRFEGIDDRNAAEVLRNRVLTGDAPGPAPDGEVWVHDVIDAEVRTLDGTTVGRVAAVEANPAHDLLVLDDGRLVPMVFVVSHVPGVVVIDPPAGLLDE